MIDVNTNPISVSITRCYGADLNCLQERRYCPLNTRQEYKIEKEFERHFSVGGELDIRTLNRVFKRFFGRDYNELKKQLGESRMEEDDEWVKNEISRINNNLYILEEKYNIINNL